jgi:transcriptional regulator with XRE-family HTH domain
VCQKGGEELMDSKKIGHRLISLRNEVSRERVASDLGISVSALAMYEQGNRIPRDEIKLKLAQYYRKTVQDIFFED